MNLEGTWGRIPHACVRLSAIATLAILLLAAAAASASAAPTISVNDRLHDEPDSTSELVTFTISLSEPAPNEVSFDTITAPGTAEARDYDARALRRFSIPAGATSTTVNVRVHPDLVDEPDDTFHLDLSNPANATIADARGNGTIVDDDAAPTLSMNDREIDEPDILSELMTFGATLSAPSEKTVTVNVNEVAGTAGPSDFGMHATSTLTFTPGATARKWEVWARPDTIDEDNEQFTVKLSNPSEATLLDGEGTGTIVDDDAAPTISVADESIPEPAGTSELRAFRVTLSNPSSREISFDAVTAAGTAEARDYDARALKRFTIPAGATSTTVNVRVNPDLVDEPDDTFHLDVSNPANATILDARGTGTIVDDDAAPTLSINDRTIDEPDTTSELITFTATLSAASEKTVTVNVDETPGTAGTSDFGQHPTSTLTFTPGATARKWEVWARPDQEVEEDETFHVDLSSPSEATIADGRWTATILDDDPMPIASISDVSVTEPSTGQVTANVTVSLSSAPKRPVTVNYATSNDTAHAGSDFTAKTGSVTIPAGSSSATVGLAVLADNFREGVEVFHIALSSPVNAVIGDDVGEITIAANCYDNEPNTQLAGASLGSIDGDLGSQTVFSADGASICAGGDVDWFKFELREASTASGDVDLSADVFLDTGGTAPNGDLDLFVYDAEGSLIGFSQGTGNADEYVYVLLTDTAAIDTQFVYVAVVGDPSSATNDYRLSVTGNT